MEWMISTLFAQSYTSRPLDILLLLKASRAQYFVQTLSAEARWEKEIKHQMRKNNKKFKCENNKVHKNDLF